MTEKENLPIEIERKFLIRYPDIATIKNLNGVRRKEIFQTYLTAEKGITARVRKVIEKGSVKYIYTEKRRISALSATEFEREITETEYRSLMTRSDPNRKTIEKVRYAVPFGEHIVEIDLYSFWKDRAVLEIELSSETERCALPPYVTLIKEVTDDIRYKNVNLAQNVVWDNLDETTKFSTEEKN